MMYMFYLSCVVGLCVVQKGKAEQVYNMHSC
jgi:hypothetical protein